MSKSSKYEGKYCAFCEKQATSLYHDQYLCPKHLYRIKTHGADIVVKQLRSALPPVIEKETHLEIELANGEFTLISLEDRQIIANRLWHKSKFGYAATKKGTSVILMHRIIMGEPPPGFVTDHVNRNKLDNRRENLRFCTPSENILNHARCGMAGGVGRDRLHNTYKAYYTGKRGRVNVGTFATYELAREARDKAYIAYLESQL